jgi:hypothetical protein
MAERALTIAIIGLLLLPLEVYVTWQLLQVWRSNEPLRPQYRRKALIALAINLPLMCVLLLLFSFCILGPPD